MVSCGFWVFHSLYTLYTLHYVIRGCFLKTILFHIISIKMFWVNTRCARMFCSVGSEFMMSSGWGDRCKKGQVWGCFRVFFSGWSEMPAPFVHFPLLRSYMLLMLNGTYMFMLCSCYFQVISSWLATTWLCTLRWRHRSWPVDEAWATSRSSQTQHVWLYFCFTFWRLNALKLFICLFWQLWVFKGAIFWGQRLVASL